MGWSQSGGLSPGNSVDSTAIVDGSIQAVDLAANCVTAVKLAPGSVSAGKIAAGGVSASSQLAAGVVNTAALAALAVTSAQLAAGAVTAGKIAAGGVSASSQLAAGVVDATALGASCVQTANIAALAVTSAQLAAGAVTAGKIAAGGVSAANQLAAGVVNTAALAAGAVTNAKLGANAVVVVGLYAAMPVANTVAAGTIYFATDSGGGAPYVSDGVTAAAAPAGWTQVAGSVSAAGVADGSITYSKLATALKPSGAAADTDEALRAIGTTAHTVADGRFGVPTGAIMPYAGTAAPANWLLCDGSSQLRATYPALFALIGTTYGSVDGTHFNLPDMRGRVPVGLDNLGGSDAGRLGVANTLGLTGGEETHLLSGLESGTSAHGHSATQASHSHPFTVSWNQILNNTATAGGSAASSIVAGGGNQNVNSNTGASSNDTVTVNASVAANAASAHNNMQPYALVGYIIKT